MTLAMVSAIQHALERTKGRQQQGEHRKFGFNNLHLM